MAVSLRFTPTGESSSANGFGPIIGADDFPVILPPPDGPVDFLLSHYRFTDRFAPGMDLEYDGNGNVLAVHGATWLNQQVAKLIQSAPDPNGLNPTYGTVLSTAVGQKRAGTFVQDIIAGNVRSALLSHQAELLQQPGITDDQAIEDIRDIFVVPFEDDADKRSLAVIVFLRTQSGQVATVSGVVSL